MESIDLKLIKQGWNEVLDELLSRDRILWLAFFDARLVSYNGSELIISFSDPMKFSGEHDFSLARKPVSLAVLEEVIKEIYGVCVHVKQVPDEDKR